MFYLELHVRVIAFKPNSGAVNLGSALQLKFVFWSIRYNQISSTGGLVCWHANSYEY